MSSMILKLIAVVTMFIDHLTASCFYRWGIGGMRVEFLNGMTLYQLGRTIGRIAFPIYCFLIVEGVFHTRNWKKYALRLGVLALLSEFPFDFGLHGLRFDLGQPQVWRQLADAIDWQHQNVFFTLLLGMLAVQFLKSTQEAIVRTQAGGTGLPPVFLWLFRYTGWAVLTLGLGYLAKNVLHTDYGMGGVVMIGMMGLIYEYWEDWLFFLPRRLIRVAVCAAALWACCEILHSTIEYYGMLALLPIGLYNGKKGYSSKALQYGFYLFYPVHLLFVGILAMLA